MVEIYFWTCGMLHEEEYSDARMLFAKTFGMVSLLDDTFDVHATLEECHKLTEAMQRWDESEVSNLPEYLRMLYIKTLSNFKEFEDNLKPNQEYRMYYIKKAYKQSSEYYLREAIWSSENYRPSFKEHEEISIMTSGLPMLTLLTLTGYSDIATKEVFEWVSGIPEMVRAGSQVTRFLNDISSYKLGKHKKDMPSSVECYMMENNTTADFSRIFAILLDPITNERNRSDGRINSGMPITITSGIHICLKSLRFSQEPKSFAMVGSEGVPLEIQNGLVRWSRVKDIGSHSREPSP
uniref:Uncharacterized protein n=1 Tax=Avena sativa TaxID=4498 RepID=A0ACD6AQG5_AVESA